MSSSPPEPGRHERFTPPPPEPVTQREARSNVFLAAVLSGVGCLLVLLVVLAVVALSSAHTHAVSCGLPLIVS